jgi:hypothetical protein
MHSLNEQQAQLRAKLFKSLDRGFVTANEVFPSLLDTFSEENIPEELETAGDHLRERIRVFLADHYPATFRPFLIGPGLDPEEAAEWEQQRRRKYAELLRALSLTPPQPAPS